MNKTLKIHNKSALDVCMFTSITSFSCVCRPDDRDDGPEQWRWRTRAPPAGLQDIRRESLLPRPTDTTAEPPAGPARVQEADSGAGPPAAQQPAQQQTLPHQGKWGRRAGGGSCDTDVAYLVWDQKTPQPAGNVYILSLSSSTPWRPSRVSLRETVVTLPVCSPWLCTISWSISPRSWRLCCRIWCSSTSLRTPNSCYAGT